MRGKLQVLYSVTKATIRSFTANPNHLVYVYPLPVLTVRVRVGKTVPFTRVISTEVLLLPFRVTMNVAVPSVPVAYEQRQARNK